MPDLQIPPIVFAPARGARIAYQRWGEGPDVVAVPPLAQNIETAWERPEIRVMFERFGSFSRYLHFDKRGTGVSDRSGRIADIDEQVDDLRAVMDHAGIDRAHLFGASEGGPVTLLFAATYPDRVRTVTLFGSGARLPPPELTSDEVRAIEARQDEFARAWGTPASSVAQRFAPSVVAVDPDFPTWHQRYERVAATSDCLRELLVLSLRTDVRDALPDVPQPVLLLHRVDDGAIPIDRARETAATLPRARLVELPGPDHFAYAGDVDRWMDEMERLVTGDVRSTPVAARRPATVSIRTLGRFSVTVDGEEVPVSAWGSRLARTLLKRLVVARGWPVTREELFDLLWPDEIDRAKLGARLSVQLSTVRRILGGGVVADRTAIRLDVDAVHTDLEAFHQATEDAAIVAAYPGDLLPEDVHEAWTAAARDEARGRFVLAARRLAETAVSGGHADEAVRLGRRLLDTDRFDETAHRLVVRALLDAGEDAEAARAHAAWAGAMAELEVEVPPLAPS